MMGAPQRERAPRQKAPSGKPPTSELSRFKYNLHAASVETFEQELALVLTAAHRIASGFGLAWDDYERLHDAHQHVLAVLATLKRQAVLQ